MYDWMKDMRESGLSSYVVWCAILLFVLSLATVVAGLLGI